MGRPMGSSPIGWATAVNGGGQVDAAGGCTRTRGGSYGGGKIFMIIRIEAVEHVRFPGHGSGSYLLIKNWIVTMIEMYLETRAMA